MLGTPVPEVASKGLAALGLLGTILLCLPDVISGFLEQRWRLERGQPTTSTPIEALNIASVAGGVLLVLVAVAFVGLVLKAAAGRDLDGDDPWEGNTLEWATTGTLPCDHLGGPGVRRPPRRRPLDHGGEVMATATATTPDRLPLRLEDVPPAPPRRPRVLLVGTTLAAGCLDRPVRRPAGRLLRRARRRHSPRASGWLPDGAIDPAVARAT